MDASTLYLSLLKKSLTDTLFNAEPDADNASEAEFLDGFIQHYIKGHALSMVPVARLDNLEYCISNVVNNNISGDLIETGVWRGGTAIFMKAVLVAYGITDRLVWVADSFAGLPEPDPVKFPVEAAAHSGKVMKEVYKHFAVSLDEVRNNFAAYGMLDSQVKFLKGWFRDTLPSAPIERLSVMRLDGDYYESTMDALRSLYDKLSVGGYVIIDDYGEDTWTYCHNAVDEFRAAHRIVDSMTKVDRHCSYWKRSC
jgi:macrocin-O-methyltransferase TylF-like protien